MPNIRVETNNFQQRTPSNLQAQLKCATSTMKSFTTVKDESMLTKMQEPVSARDSHRSKTCSNSSSRKELTQFLLTKKTQMAFKSATPKSLIVQQHEFAEEEDDSRRVLSHREKDDVKHKNKDLSILTPSDGDKIDRKDNKSPQPSTSKHLQHSRNTDAQEQLKRETFGVEKVESSKDIYKKVHITPLRGAYFELAPL